MSESIFKSNISEDIKSFKDVNPDLYGAWMKYHGDVFKDGALTKKEKELTAVAVAHITACPYCIRARVTNCKNLGASDEEIVEAIYVGMRFAMGAPFAYSSIAFEASDAIDNDIPLTDGQFFKKNIAKEIGDFKKSSGESGDSFGELTKTIFADGALSKKLKRGIIGLACAHAAQCPYCIRGCVKDAKADGYSKEQIAEAINVAMVMCAGSGYAHASIAMDAIKKFNDKQAA